MATVIAFFGISYMRYIGYVLASVGHVKLGMEGWRSQDSPDLQGQKRVGSVVSAGRVPGNLEGYII